MYNVIKVASFVNVENGIESYVLECKGGFRVFIKDTDANEILPAYFTFPTLERAIANAQNNVAQ